MFMDDVTITGLDTAVADIDASAIDAGLGNTVGTIQTLPLETKSSRSISLAP